MYNSALLLRNRIFAVGPQINVAFARRTDFEAVWLCALVMSATQAFETSRVQIQFYIPRCFETGTWPNIVGVIREGDV
jgi:hypothetical protein